MQKHHSDGTVALAVTLDDLISLLNDEFQHDSSRILFDVVHSLSIQCSPGMCSVGRLDYCRDASRKASQRVKVVTEAEEILVFEPSNENETLLFDNVTISATRRAELPCLNTSAMSWSTSRIIRSLWQMPWTLKSPR
jgi:hypothetical protein